MERKPNILLPVPSIGEQRDLLREVLHLEMQNDMHTRIHSTRSAEYYMSNLLENNSVIIETIWVHYHFTYKQYCTITNELMVVLAYNFSANIEKIFLYHINIINTIDSVDLEHYKNIFSHLEINSTFYFVLKSVFRNLHWKIYVDYLTDHKS